MKQKLLNITIRRFDRPDGTVGVHKNVLIHEILPDGTKKPVGYHQSYIIKSREALTSLEKLSA